MLITMIPNYMMENEPSSKPHPPEEEKRIIAKLKNGSEAHLKEGKLYYVISIRWFSSWERYVGQESCGYLSHEQSSDSHQLDMAPSKIPDRPGPIDNSDIVLNRGDCKSDDVELRRTLREGKNYVLVPQEVWEKLFEWYKGGPALPRKLISQGVIYKKSIVEVYPLSLKLIDSRDNSQSIILLSRKASVCELYEKVCELRGIEQEKACIWDYFNEQKQLKLVASNLTLEESHLQMDQYILLEEQVDGHYPSGLVMDATGNDLASVPLESSRPPMPIAWGPTTSNGHATGFKRNLDTIRALGSSFMDTEDEYGIYSSVRKGETAGLAGLENLGNTCFMNSAIQCIVHTPALVEYFFENYTEDINKKNPLGMNGELAHAFGELLRTLWSLGKASIAPRVFREKLTQYAPQFGDYNQHDSQELLAFLLDGLHEDLNRVKQKPYIEMKDSYGRPDEEVADESWEYHKARNDSVIVDVYQGQYKSKLICPVCRKISITFDPFMYLSLPLPSTVASRTMTVTVFCGDGSGLPMPFSVTVLKHGCCGDLSQALGTACFLRSDESLLLAEVYEHRIFRYLESPLQPLCLIKDDEHIVAYRLPKNRAGEIRLEVVHRWQETCDSDNLKSGEKKFCGTPLVTYIGEDWLRGTDIDTVVLKMLSPLGKTIFSSSKDPGSEDNGFVSQATNEPTNSCNVQSGPRNQSMENTEVGVVSNMELSLRLSLRDGIGLNYIPIQKDSLVKPDWILKVLLDWTDKEHELYDASYLEDLPEVHKTMFTANKTGKEVVSLFSCLELFLREEPLGPDDMWYCSSCKEHRQATKKLDLWRLPEVLVFHLKRFSLAGELSEKLETFVDFPVHNLDLSEFVKSNDGQSHVYELFSISNHYGSVGLGHYTAYAKLTDGNRWYHFDDTHVSLVSQDDIKTSAAYLLFYQRVKDEEQVGMGETPEDHMDS